MPWQDVAATYLTAKGRDDRHLFQEVCIVVARQNGKTHLMKPLIIGALRAGKRVMHIAQTRELPRAMFGLIAESLEADLFLKRRGKGGRLQTVWPRFGAGSEEILLANGGKYKIAAASQGGARGQTNDLVIIDELREMETDEVIASAEPTLATSDDPQMVYLSNAGTDTSVVLNAVRARADTDPSLAYLEWSADTALDIGDVAGWAQANPAMGHTLPLDYLERKYRSYTLAGTSAIFETEHLCRWVSSMRERFVDEYAFAACRGPLGDPKLPVIAVSMTPDGRRAAVAMAWQRPDQSVALRLLYDVTGSPIDTGKLGADIDRDARRIGARRIGYDPLTDAELAKYLRKSEKITGQVFANASAQFVNLVTAGRLRWQDDGTLAAEMAATSRKAHDDTGHFQAVRMTDDRPIPSVLASIRAVWLASGPASSSPRVY